MLLTSLPRAALPTALLIVLLSGCGTLRSGGGVVFNPWTSAPVAGAKVTLVCARVKFQGTENVRTLEVTTNEQGEYQFSPADVFGCDLARLQAWKPGFVVISDWYPQGCALYEGGASYITPQICMVKESELAPTRLKYLNYQAAFFMNRWRQAGAKPEEAPVRTLDRLLVEANALAPKSAGTEQIRKDYCAVLAAQRQNAPQCN